MKPFFLLTNDIAIKDMQDLKPLHVAVLEDDAKTAKQITEQRYVEEIGADRCGESAAGTMAIAREALGGNEHCSK